MQIDSIKHSVAIQSWIVAMLKLHTYICTSMAMFFIVTDFKDDCTAFHNSYWYVMLHIKLLLLLIVDNHIS